MHRTSQGDEWRYNDKLVKSGNGSPVHETPDKNAYSHVSDALQYLLAGGGEYA